MFLEVLDFVLVRFGFGLFWCGGFGLGCLLSARIEVISVSSSTSSGSSGVGARDMVVVILDVGLSGLIQCWRRVWVFSGAILSYKVSYVVDAQPEIWGFGVVCLRHVITSTSDAIMQKLGLNGLGLLDYFITQDLNRS